MSIDAMQAIEHIRTCPECMPQLVDHVTCTMCGRIHQEGYVLDHRGNMNHLTRVRINGTSQEIYWGLCLECAEIIKFYPVHTDERSLLNNMKYDLEKSMQAFKDRIYGRNR